MVAIAGASGYIGRALTEALRDDHRVIALSRHAPDDAASLPSSPGVTRRKCDLFSLGQVTRGLEGADVAVYLVHSMLPSARLTQASFEDLDLILADNFARAARRAGAAKIVYLGGIIPEGGSLSPHLRSRLEVEHALSFYGVPTISLRAGLVVGPEGSSFLILQRLVERLPAMVLPAWTKNRSQPIALRDVVELLRLTIVDHEPQTTNYDVAGREVITFRSMIGDVARAVGKRSPLVDVRWFSPRLSCLWISLVSGQPYALVAPLVESLLHEMLARDDRLMTSYGFSPTPWPDALAKALSPEDQRPAPARNGQRNHDKKQSLVRSVQRLPRPLGASAQAIARSYMSWLPAALGPFVHVTIEDETIKFRLRPFPWPLLVLRHASDGSSSERELFHVIGGLLAAPTPVPGRLEFRLTPDERSVVAAIHEFRPRLPWYVYRCTQALLHLWVMRAFGRFLARRGASQNERTVHS